VGGEAVKVEEVSLSVLQNIVLFDKDGTKDRLDLRPCTLENYVSICKKYEKHCVLELKSDFTEEETEKYINIIKSLDYLENVTFISFHHDNLRKLRKILPSQSAQFLFTEMTEDDIKDVISEKFDVDVHYKALTEDLVKRFHDAGIKVNCWTVDIKEDAEDLVAMGVDFITTNILE
jgi:glycerophosphoryl diester phosphodiesterase